jgi:hypothetical protein
MASRFIEESKLMAVSDVNGIRQASLQRARFHQWMSEAATSNGRMSKPAASSLEIAVARSVAGAAPGALDAKPRDAMAGDARPDEARPDETVGAIAGRPTGGAQSSSAQLDPITKALHSSLSAHRLQGAAPRAAPPPLPHLNARAHANSNDDERTDQHREGRVWPAVSDGLARSGDGPLEGEPDKPQSAAGAGDRERV